MIIETNQNSTKILQPCKKALDLPASFVAAKFSSVLRSLALSIRFMRRNQLGFKRGEAFIKRIRIISLIANQSNRSHVGKTRKQCLLDKSDFMRRSTFRVDGERKTRAICHCHEFRTFPPLGFSHSEAPFLATINVPSIKHSDKSRPPRECKSAAKVSRTRRSVPSLTHSWKRRWQVWYGGKRSGKSCQRAPLRSIHSTPFKTSCAERIGLPRVWTASGLPKSGFIKDHCSSVNSSRRAMARSLANYF